MKAGACPPFCVSVGEAWLQYSLFNGDTETPGTGSPTPALSEYGLTPVLFSRTFCHLNTRHTRPPSFSISQLTVQYPSPFKKHTQLYKRSKLPIKKKNPSLLCYSSMQLEMWLTDVVSKNFRKCTTIYVACTCEHPRGHVLMNRERWRCSRLSRDASQHVIFYGDSVNFKSKVLRNWKQTAFIFI